MVYRQSITLGLLSNVFPDFILYPTYCGGLYWAAVTDLEKSVNKVLMWLKTAEPKPLKALKPLRATTPCLARCKTSS